MIEDPISDIVMDGYKVRVSHDSSVGELINLTVLPAPRAQFPAAVEYFKEFFPG